MKPINTNNWKILIRIFLVMPVLLFNLWTFLFKDWLLANTFYLIFIFFIPKIFKKIYDFKMDYFVKEWQDFKAFEENNVKNEDEKFYIFSFVIILGYIIFLIANRFHKFDIIINILFPYFENHKIFEIFYIILSFYINIFLLPKLEVKYYFVIGYNSFNQTFVGKVFIGLIFCIKYFLMSSYIFKDNSLLFWIFDYFKLFILFFIIAYIYSGESKKIARKCLKVVYLIMFINFIILSYKSNLNLLSPEVVWNNEGNLFNKIFNWNNINHNKDIDVLKFN